MFISISHKQKPRKFNEKKTIEQLYFLSLQNWFDEKSTLNKKGITLKEKETKIHYQEMNLRAQ